MARTALVVIERGSKAAKLMAALKSIDPKTTWRIMATQGHYTLA